MVVMARACWYAVQSSKGLYYAMPRSDARRIAWTPELSAAWTTASSSYAQQFARNHRAQVVRLRALPLRGPRSINKQKGSTCQTTTDRSPNSPAVP